jgi:curved DNA-binding protein CbpA
MSSVDLYKILQVDSEAEDEVIQAAYRRLARKYHPDVAGAEPAIAERMSRINEAWAILRDPILRAKYDAHRQRRREPAAASPATPPRPRSTPAASEPSARDWTSGRSNVGGRYEPSMRAADTHGAAGPPPGNASGSVLTFGRYAGWSLGEVARHDPGFLEWLDRMTIGRPYRGEIDTLLRRGGRRGDATSAERRGLFRRR